MHIRLRAATTPKRSARPFGRSEAAIWRGDFEEKARENQVASPGADKPGAMMHVFGQASSCLKIEERNRELIQAATARMTASSPG
jgi:hypothetical protein